MTDRWDDLRERLQRAEAGQAGPDEAIGIPSAAVRGRTQGIRLALSYMDDADRAGPSLTSANEQVSEPTPDDLRERIRDTITESLRAMCDFFNAYVPIDDDGNETDQHLAGVDGFIDLDALTDAIIRDLGLGGQK